MFWIFIFMIGLIVPVKSLERGVCQQQDLKSEFCSCYTDDLLNCESPITDEAFERCEREEDFPSDLFFKQIFLSGQGCIKLLDNLARLNYQEITFRDIFCSPPFHNCT